MHRVPGDDAWRQGLPRRTATELSHDDEAALALYQALRAQSGSGVGEVTDAAGLDEAQAGRGWALLREVGLVRGADTEAEPVAPDVAMVRAMDDYHESASRRLREARALQGVTESLMTVFRPAVAREEVDVAVEVLRDVKHRTRTLIDLNSALRETCDSLHPGPMPAMEVLQQSLRRDEEMLHRGVRVRAVYPRSLLRSAKHARYLHDLAALGAAVRLVEHAPFDMVIFDGHTALLPGDPGRPSRMGIHVRGAALLRCYLALYEDCWRRGVPLAEAAAGDDTEVSEQERTIIRLMSSGLSDDQIARKLGVHRRTVQRAVAKLMERLNATGRFEAGLKLARDPGLLKTYPVI